MDEVLQCLNNVGVDTECGACAEVVFTGSTDKEHTCKTPLSREERKAQKELIEDDETFMKLLRATLNGSAVAMIQIRNDREARSLLAKR
jgi:hypothetical protein